jgi:para-aminobenzoate synthetase component I
MAARAGLWSLPRAETTQLDLDAPPERLFAALRREPYAAFLDSASRPRGGRGTSYVAYRPSLVIRAKGRRVEVRRGDRVARFLADPLEVLREVLKEHAPGPHAGGAACRPGIGLIGYLGYELGGRIETLPMTRRDDLCAPDLYLCLHETILRHDHATGAWTASTIGRGGARAVRSEVRTALDAAESRRAPRERRGAGSADLRSTFTRGAYLQAVRRAKRYIRDGHIYQVNLSQRFSAELRVDPWELYVALRRINPAPYACYLGFPDIRIASSSPELFLDVRGREVETRPIKGTRPRGRDAAEDRRMGAELRSSAKDAAELSMIVDLERNDLGRVCEPGSVRVSGHRRLERYATVFHTVSTVRGRMREECDLVDLLRATFPGGSITGCPKIRAMEIIDELEPTVRGPYTGAIGFLGLDGNATLNIAIRTLVLKGRRVTFSVGGGIVADSDPAAEYQETLDKAEALVRALGARDGVS